jgi:hypothetical protein
LRSLLWFKSRRDHKVKRGFERELLSGRDKPTQSVYFWRSLRLFLIRFTTLVLAPELRNCYWIAPAGAILKGKALLQGRWIYPLIYADRDRRSSGTIPAPKPRF